MSRLKMKWICIWINLRNSHHSNSSCKADWRLQLFNSAYTPKKKMKKSKWFHQEVTQSDAEYINNPENKTMNNKSDDSPESCLCSLDFQNWFSSHFRTSKRFLCSDKSQDTSFFDIQRQHLLSGCFHHVGTFVILMGLWSLTISKKRKSAWVSEKCQQFSLWKYPQL